MSRHTIPNAPGSPEGRTTVVGWDPCQATFYASVTQWMTDPGDDEYGDDIEVLAVGDSPCELPTIGDLARALGEHGIDLPVDVATALGEDYQREGKRFAGRPATNLIAAMSVTYAGPEQAERISAALTGQDQAGGAA